MKYALEHVVNGLLSTDTGYVARNKTHDLFSVRVPREVIARNDFFLEVLSEIASDVDVAPAPLPKRRNLARKLLKVPFGYIGADDEFVLFSVRIARKSLAKNHAMLPIIAALVAGATPWADDAVPQARSK